jgi:hypothetical protein
MVFLVTEESVPQVRLDNQAFLFRKTVSAKIYWIFWGGFAIGILGVDDFTGKDCENSGSSRTGV